MPDRTEPAPDDPRGDEPKPDGPLPHAAPDEPQQIVLMQRMVELSIERTRQAEQRTRMSADRSRMSADRSRMSAERSEMSAERSYLNAERTLSVWIRTALAVMVVGIAVARFGLSLLQNPADQTREGTAPDLVGAGMVAFGVLIAVVTSVRFRRYAAAYCRTHTLPDHHGPFMAPAFGVLVALFGLVLLIMLLTAP